MMEHEKARERGKQFAKTHTYEQMFDYYQPDYLRHLGTPPAKEIIEDLNKQLTILDTEMETALSKIRPNYPNGIPVEVLIRTVGPIARKRGDIGLRKLKADEEQSI